MNKLNKGLTLCLIGVFISFVSCISLFGRPVLPDSISSLWTKYKHADSDSARVMYLSRLAYFYNDYLSDAHTSDSLAETAIQVAEMSLRPGLLMLACNNYIESTDNEIYFEKALSYANKALQTCRITENRQMQWKTCKNMAEIYLTQYNFDNAMLCSNEALAIANTLKNDTMVSLSYLYVGRCHEYKNQKIDAFRNFLIAKEMAEVLGDPKLLIKCYGWLSKFYNDNKLFDDAVEYKHKEGAILLTIKPIDSVALMWVQFDLQLIDVRQKINKLNEQNVKSIINYAIRTRNDRLKAGEFAIYRKYLLESDDVISLYNFYSKAYPKEFDKLYLTDTEMYYRLKAYFAELEKKTDSADQFLKGRNNLSF